MATAVTPTTAQATRMRGPPLRSALSSGGLADIGHERVSPNGVLVPTRLDGPSPSIKRYEMH